MKLETMVSTSLTPIQHSKSRASLNVVRWQPELFKKKKKKGGPKINGKKKIKSNQRKKYKERMDRAKACLFFLFSLFACLKLVSLATPGVSPPAHT